MKERKAGVTHVEASHEVTAEGVDARAQQGRHEYQASERLRDAAAVLASEECALQLRYLQTLSEIATEGNSTTIFPVPIDILKPFYQMAAKAKGGEGA